LRTVHRSAGEQGRTTPGAFRSRRSTQTCAFLADLHPVQAITVWLLITTPPPPSVLHFDILASLSGKAVAEFPSSAWMCYRNP